MADTYVVRFKGKDTNAADEAQARAWAAEGRGKAIRLTDTEEIDLSPTPTPTPKASPSPNPSPSPSPSPSPTPKVGGLRATSVNRGAEREASGNYIDRMGTDAREAQDATTENADVVLAAAEKSKKAVRDAAALSEARREALKAKLKK